LECASVWRFCSRQAGRKSKAAGHRRTPKRFRVPGDASASRADNCQHYRILESSISVLESRLALVRMRRMKTQLLARIFFSGIAVLLLQACATAPKSGPAALAGTWTNSMGTVWTMMTDGSFEVDLNHDGKRDAWGKCTIEGDTVTIAGTGGVEPKGCAKTTGVYHFTRNKDTVHFTLVKDPCKERVKNITLDWSKK
jgi:hypothetical protein